MSSVMEIDNSQNQQVWDWIPQTELFVQIFYNLYSKDLFSCAQVNKKFHQVIVKNETILWRGVCAKEWAESPKNIYGLEIEGEVLNGELCGVKNWKEAWKHGPKGTYDAFGKALSYIKNEAKPEYIFFNNFNPAVLPAIYFTEIFRTQLRRLYMDKNAIISLPKSIGLLSKITFLDLSHNKLTQLPAEMAKLTMLEVLDLSYNSFSQLNAAALSPALKTLRLAHNELVDLPIELSSLTKLKTISLSNNPMQQLPKVVFTWASIERLQIGTIPFNVDDLKVFSSLAYLYVDVKDIEAVKKAAKEVGITAAVDKERKEIEAK